MSLDKSVSYKGQKQVDTLTSKVRLEEGKGRLIVSDGENNIGLFGYDEDGNVVVKVAKPGYNAESATDSQLIFNSSQNTLKVVQTASVVQTLTNTANTVAQGTQVKTIAHNLGFKPAFLVYMTTNPGYVSGEVLIALPDLFVLPSGHSLGGGTIFSKFWATADDNNLYINYFHRVSTDYSPSAPTFTVRYYLLQETAN